MFPQLHLETTLALLVPGVNKQAVPGAMVRVSTQRRVTLATISARTRTPCGHSASVRDTSRHQTKDTIIMQSHFAFIWTVDYNYQHLRGDWSLTVQKHK